MNVLVALAWPNHVHHARAIAWFVRIREGGWATCPVTESGFVRVSSNTRAIPDAKTPAAALDLLRRLKATGRHEFWVDDVQLTEDPFGVLGNVVGFRQVTDAHLLSLALQRGGRLATFDRGARELAGAHGDAVLLLGDA